MIQKHGQGPCGFCGEELQWYFDTVTREWSNREMETGLNHWRHCDQAREYHEKAHA